LAFRHWTKIIAFRRITTILVKNWNPDQAYVYKGNNKITEQSYKGRKTENRNDPDLVQAFLKKWWVESDFKAPNLMLD